MKYISLTGHISGMNHVVNRWLSRFDIQLEPTRHNLMKPFTTLNPYALTLQKAEKFAKIAGRPPALYVPVLPAEAVNLVESAAAIYEQRDIRLRELENQLSQARLQIDEIMHFSSLNIDLRALSQLEFVHFCFGKFKTEQFKRFEKFLSSDEKIIFQTAKREKEYVHGVFFTPVSHREEVDAVFASLEFEMLNSSFASLEFGMTPAALLHHLRNEVLQKEKEVNALTIATFSELCSAEKLAIACAKVRDLYAAFDVKKFAAISPGRRVFTFSGWMNAEDADTLEEEIESDNLVLFTRHVDIERDEARPPTLLKNLPIIRQFEFFTRLYGLPEYGEIDPTPVLAITYTFLFGLMFGDIGHGLVLAALGVIVQRRFQPNLGGIMTVVGVSAAAFGVLYGSVFGFEFQPLWRRPTTNITETLIFAAALGAGLIALSMLFNMYNSLKRGKLAELLFGANGIAGLMFYSAGLWLVIRVIVQNRPVTVFVACVAVLPLVFICFKQPFENFLAGQRIVPKGGTAAFIGGTAIQLFETLLTYATNTISFVRVGAFAVSHVGMMHVVLQLSRGAAGTQNLLILILGNIIVMLIEGLLVGIQVLRLDFYEIFSRFYKGTGREFQKTL
ncbi:MAG: hypothetical protein FWF79_03465 [Defluviitaleaceae bacterium]|nr:hypothetical protein [Defluviitaleaceae bacterium]